MAGLRGKALIAYLLVCSVWGSTYLFIRIGVADLPPFLFAGVRFLIAGPAARRPSSLPLRRQAAPHRGATGAPSPSPASSSSCGANAIVVWAEQFVASGIASVYVAVGAALDRVLRRDRARRQDAADLADRRSASLSGFLGTALLAGVTPDELATADMRGPDRADAGSASWALGSVYWKRHPTEVIALRRRRRCR